MEEKPLISIILPTYNRANLISETIDSILNQTYQNWELLVVDDKSKDKTKQIISEYTNRDDRIKYLYNNYKPGPACARNFGFDNAEGDYIAFIDSDDLWINNHLENSFKVINSNEIDFCVSLWIQDLNGKLIYDNVKPEHINDATDKLKPIVKDSYIIWNEDFYEYSILNRFYCTLLCTLVIKKKVILEIGKFNEELLATSDDEFFFRLCQNRKFALIRDYQYIWRWGNDNICAFSDPKDTKSLIFHRKYAIKSRKMMKNGIKHSNFFRNVDGCLRVLDRKIAEYCLETARAYRKDPLKRFFNQIKALHFYLKSIYHYYDRAVLREAIKMIIKGIKAVFLVQK